MNNRSRLAWRCRRGMREMDILFERFLREDYDGLGVQQQAVFEAFIDVPDADIYSWLTGHTEPENEDYRYFVERLQAKNS